MSGETAMSRRSGEQQVLEKSGRKDKDGFDAVCDGLGDEADHDARDGWLHLPSVNTQSLVSVPRPRPCACPTFAQAMNLTVNLEVKIEL
jgi:hypothetical protein